MKAHLIALVIITKLFLVACAVDSEIHDDLADSPTNARENTTIEDWSYEKTGISSIENVADCDASQYDLDCDMTKFLEETVAWTTRSNARNFCAYDILDTQDSAVYLQVFCEEFYPQDEKILCPDEASRKHCFMSKDDNKEACRQQCDIQKVSPYLTTGSAISVPVKITRENGNFSIWMPRDGSGYTKDLKEHFSPEAHEKLRSISGIPQRHIYIERAEKHFGVGVPFDIAEEMGQSCSTHDECAILPMNYATRSSCPYEVQCRANQCVIGCYDFTDYTDFPEIKNTFE